MGLKIYLPAAIAVFLDATTGADVIARTSIAGEPFEAALREHLYYAGRDFIRTILLLVPFIAVAFVFACAAKKARSRSVAILFTMAMVALLYFYFQGYLESQHALAEERWTSAALSIVILPFFIGLPVALVSLAAALLAVRLDRQMSD
jgi:hypothetical protein